MSGLDEDAEGLADEIQELARSFANTSSGLAMPPATLEKWQARLLELGPTRSDALVRDLLALAAKFQRLAPEATKTAVDQLADLAARLLADPARAGPMVREASLDRSRAAKLIAAEQQTLKNAPPPEGSMSPLALRAGDKKKPAKRRSRKP
jgi:hypothetical protein